MTQNEALDILKTGANVFLTGEPGAGKTHTIREYVAYLRAHGIEPSITASSGIAATHIHGQTIHSWAGIGIKNHLSDYDLDAMSSKEYLVKKISRATVLIIDEISMLGAGTLQMVDQVCRAIRNNDSAFGGLQVVLVGDFFQLPPISSYGSNSEFAYESPAWKSLSLITCYITEQHRQEDGDLLAVLSAIRRNEVEEMHFEKLQSRITTKEASPEGITRLFTKNVSVDALNDESLKKIVGLDYEYEMQSQGKVSMVEALKKGCLSPEVLVLKKDSVVMCTKNNMNAGFVNGTLGRVVDFQKGTDYPIIQTRDGRTLTIEPMEWVVEEDGKIRARITQIPLRLAWAITVHKSQGMSLDSAVMDLSDVFEYGQGYVALSRVRTLSGIHLFGLNQKSLQVHPEVASVDAHFRQVSDKAMHSFRALEENELKNMHANFIRACGGNLVPVKNVKPGKKISTQEKTLALLEAGFTISGIAKERDLNIGTIIDHVDYLVKNGSFSKESALNLCDPRLKLSLPIINKAYDKKGTIALAPVFSHLKGVYSYDELKLARVFY